MLYTHIRTHTHLQVSATSLMVSCACPARANRWEGDTLRARGVYAEEEVLLGVRHSSTLSYRYKLIVLSAKRVSLFTGLDYWTGLLDSKFTHKISFPAQLQPPKAIVSPHLKSLGHQDIYLVQCNQSIVATPQYQTNCRGAFNREVT